MIPLDEAISLLKQTLESLNFEKKIVNLEIQDSVGFITAENIYSPIDIPEYDNSAMDGIAVSSINTQYKLINYTEIIPENYAIEINTGQKIPFNTLTIIEKENYIITNSTVQIKDIKKVKLHKNKRLKGEEIKKGQLVIPKFTEILPRTVGILSKIGKSTVNIILPPKVGIIITGSELVEPNEKIILNKADKIFNSNGPLLKSLLKQMNIHNTLYSLLPDKYETIKSTILNFIKELDFLIITGGASEGKYDLSKIILEEIGLNKLFYKVAIKPGKPFYIYK